jgi:hypothetical protein
VVSDGRDVTFRWPGGPVTAEQDFEASTVSTFKGDRGTDACATWINDGEKYGLVGLSVKS